MRESFQVTLYDKSGNECKGTVKRSTIDTASKLQESQVKLQMLREERQAIWLSTTDINREHAIAEVEFNAAPVNNREAETERLTKARARRDATEVALKKKDEAIRGLLCEQIKLITNVSKGSGPDGATAEKAPEIDWGATDMETITEATSFFLTGKRPSETPASGENANGAS